MSATIDAQAPSSADNPSFTTEVMALRAQLRCAFARLQAVEGYDEPGERGEALTDVGWALIDGGNRLEVLYERMDAAGVA
jgi:hypothetical protein